MAVVASELMQQFVAITHLSPATKSPQRYLWSDAFAVLNLFELARLTKDKQFEIHALDLIEQVHDTLGKHREDDPLGRAGWLSGEKDATHPCRAGLRIGEQLPECSEGKRDNEIESDSDGQYYHHLTKWMFALNVASSTTGDARYNDNAIELARAAHKAFVYATGARNSLRLYRKMSIDLSKPLVNSMGHHDPLDGLISYLETDPKGLYNEIADLASVCGDNKAWVTNDAMGIGGLLCDMYRLSVLATRGVLDDYPGLLASVIEAARLSLDSFSLCCLPTEYRTAFGELRLSLGLQGIPRAKVLLHGKSDTIRHLKKLERLEKFLPLVEKIHWFWRDERNQMARSWTEHRHTNMVMLSTSLLPAAFYRN